MKNTIKRKAYPARLKHLLMVPLFLAFLCISTHAFAQSQPSSPPPGGPPPPPPPDEVLRKINPFKKHKKDTTSNKKSDDKTTTPPIRNRKGDKKLLPFYIDHLFGFEEFFRKVIFQMVLLYCKF